MIGRRKGKHHRRTTEAILREVRRDLPDGVRAMEISDTAISGFATMPDDANVADYDWGIAYNADRDQWAVVVAERRVGSELPLVTVVSSQEIGTYICYIHHYVKEEMRQHEKQKAAEEDSKPADDAGEDSRVESVPVGHGESGMQTPWPRVAREDV